MSSYLIEYIGCCGQECCVNFEGDIPGLLREITWIEERGGWGISVTDEAGEFLYEDGKLLNGVSRQNLDVDDYV